MEMVNWKDVLTIQNGKNQKKVQSSNGKYPIYGSGGEMGRANEFLCPEGTTIIGRKGSINNPIFVNERFWNVDTAFGLIAGEKLNKKYLYYFCKTYNFLKHNKATTLPSLTKLDLLKIKMPLPPIETQKRIAQILDDAAELRDKTKQLLEEYNALAQSIFLDMFGDPVTNPKDWDKVKLEDLCEVGSSKRVFVKDLVNSGVPFYRGKEIGELSEGKKIKTELYISNTHYKTLKDECGVPKIGDLLLPSICPDGRIYIVGDNKPFYFKDGRVLWIKVNQEIVDSVYLRFFLRELFKANYHNIASGTTFAELKIFALKKASIIIPPKELQLEFAKRVELINKQTSLTQLELIETENLFNCLLQKAFNGELVKK